MGDILYRGNCRCDGILYYRILGDEMVNDLIYREDAIKAACEGFCHPGIFCPDTGCKELDLIKNLPAAERWIPCSERLPKHDDYDETFIVTMQCKHVDGWPDYAVCSADWTPHGWDTWGEPLGSIKVVAWMPLPEPYKGEQDG